MKCQGKENHISTRWWGSCAMRMWEGIVELLPRHERLLTKGYLSPMALPRFLLHDSCKKIKNKDQATYLRKTERGLKIGDVL